MNNSRTYSVNKQNNLSHFVLLAFGANLGKRKENIEKAFTLLDQYDSISLLKISSFYSTEPLGKKPQPEFINAAAIIHTSLDARALLILLKEIEVSIGRKERPRWNEREIDIDILLFDSIVINEKSLVIPHSEMHKRNFVLVPAAEIAADIIHPVLNKSIRQLLMESKDTLYVRKSA